MKTKILSQDDPNYIEHSKNIATIIAEAPMTMVAMTTIRTPIESIQPTPDPIEEEKNRRRGNVVDMCDQVALYLELTNARTEEREVEVDRCCRPSACSD